MLMREMEKNNHQGHQHPGYIAFRNSCFGVMGLPQPSSSSFASLCISLAFSASTTGLSSTRPPDADLDELLLRRGVFQLKKAVVDDNFGMTTRNRSGRNVGKQAVITPAQSSPNDHPAGAMFLYVGSSPKLRNSMRTTEITHVL